ncbi:hypothetical protein EDD86DRAFT_186274 [Gorgonomyces haynaldii]|nr:hypothetical protein EDD86DRAFT_186274 [Gorgonomyces haynaldii]
MHSLEDRDFIGYGPKTPDPQWPNNAKLAISFVVNYEEGGENTILNGDPASEIYLTETPGGQPKQGLRDISTETMFEYGSRAGVWRIMRLFDQKGFKFTCYAVGKAVECHPEVIREMSQRGHEIASHNYRWIDYQKLSEQEQREHVQKCVKAIVQAHGKAPVGWYTGRIGDNSRRIVWEEYKKMGLPLLYDCDAYNDDLPYWVHVNGEGHLIIPYTLDQNDMKFSVAPGFGGPDAYFSYLKNCVDILLEEGREGSPKMLSIGLHCRLVGKPGRAAALKQFLEYIAGFGNEIWVCTRQEIALHWRSKFPFESQ